MTELQRRLQRIVDVVFAGSANAASVAASVEPSTLHRLLDGTVANPRMDTLKVLAQAFGVPVGWIMGDVSTVTAQHPGKPLTEPSWLLRAYHTAQRQAARQTLLGEGPSERAPAPELTLSRILSSDFEYSEFPAAEVRRIFEQLDHDDPEKLDLERRVAQLYTDLLLTAAQLSRSPAGRSRVTKSRKP